MLAELVPEAVGLWFLASAIPLVVETGLQACAGFLWEEPVPAHWWVELGINPLVAMAMAMDMSRGSCGLRNPLASASANG